MFAQVIVDIANSGVDRLFTYRAEDNIILGQRVLVPFGSGNKPIEGYVLGISESYGEEHNTPAGTVQRADP